MGFDVIGKHPVSEEGTYFRRNIWWWHDLWMFTCEVGKEAGIIDDDLAKGGCFNDGEGLNGVDAAALSAVLLENIEKVQGRKPLLAFKTDQGAEFTYYPCREKDVREWATFLRDCGGFEIW